MFEELTIGSKLLDKKNRIRHEFIHMSLFVSDMEGEGHNLKPLSKSEYEDYILNNNK